MSGAPEFSTEPPCPPMTTPAQAGADRPILFSGPMVRALLNGRKTQTRRMLMPQPETVPGRVSGPHQDCETCQWGMVHTAWRYSETLGNYEPESETLVPFRVHAVGTRLWVRERLECANGEAIGYPAGGTWFPNDCWRWSRQSLPSIHMPRSLSRLTLTVTDVRVQRLQDISADDAEAEGCPPCPRCGDCGWINGGPDGGWQCTEPGCGDAYVDQYARLWNDINGAGAWDRNDWVAAYTFTVERRNIDASPISREG